MRESRTESFARLQESDAIFASQLIHEGKLKPDLEKHLVRSLAIRRSMCLNVTSLEDKTFQNIDRLYKEMGDYLGDIGQEDYSKEVKDSQEKYLQIDLERKKQSAVMLDNSLILISYLSTQIVRSKIDKLSKLGKLYLTLEEFRKILTESEADAEYLLQIVNKRIPLFPIQAISALEKAIVTQPE